MRFIINQIIDRLSFRKPPIYRRVVTHIAKSLFVRYFTVHVLPTGDPRFCTNRKNRKKFFLPINKQLIDPPTLLWLRFRIQIYLAFLKKYELSSFFNMLLNPCLQSFWLVSFFISRILL